LIVSNRVGEERSLSGESGTKPTNKGFVYRSAGYLVYMTESITIGNARIECVEGDIALQNTEAIVNAANNHLWMGSGVAGAIKRAGGQVIEDEAVAQGPIPPGEAVITSGGKLTANWVIHAAGMGQDLRTNADFIRLATASSLRRAEENGIHSISFPSIGTGVGGFPLDECAQIMIGQAVEHLRKSRHIELVRFVLWGTEAYEAFVGELKEHG
jgi:O-acetyl-ADP-ribose deacetylase